MLTTTYSIVVLSSEQQNARRILAKLGQCLRNAAWKDSDWKDADGISVDWLENVFNKLMMIDNYCHERKVELYVIPAIRKVSTEADTLLDLLDSISADALRILRYAYDQIQRVIEGAEVDIEMLIASMEMYCKQVLERLELEEEELFPIARRLLTEQDWLRLAACCLSDAGMQRGACRQTYASGIHNRGHRRFRYVH